MSYRFDDPSLAVARLYRTVPTPAGRFTRHVIDARGAVDLWLTIAAQYMENHFSPLTAQKYEAAQRQFRAYQERVAPDGLADRDVPALVAGFFRDCCGCAVRARAGGLYEVRPSWQSGSHLRGIKAAIDAMFDAAAEYELFSANPLRLAETQLRFRWPGDAGRLQPISAIVIRGASGDRAGLSNRNCGRRCSPPPRLGPLGPISPAGSNLTRAAGRAKRWAGRSAIGRVMAAPYAPPTRAEEGNG